MNSQNNKYIPFQNLPPRCTDPYVLYILAPSTTICQLPKPGPLSVILNSPLTLTLSQSFTSFDSTGFMCLELIKPVSFPVQPPSNLRFPKHIPKT